MRPFFSIWIKPTETFKYLEERRLAGKENYIEYLFALVSLSLFLPNINNISKLAKSELFGFVISIVFAPVVGLFVFYLISYFVWRIGKILNGKATLAEIQLVVAYSSIPHLIHLVIALIFIIPAIQADNINLILDQHPITFIVISLFTIRNLIFGLSYFNKYTYGYAVLNIVILGTIFEAISLMIKH